MKSDFGIPIQFYLLSCSSKLTQNQNEEFQLCTESCKESAHDWCRGRSELSKAIPSRFQPDKIKLKFNKLNYLINKTITIS